MDTSSSFMIPFLRFYLEFDKLASLKQHWPDIMVTTAHGRPEANLEVFTTSGQINFKFNPLGYTMENLMGLSQVRIY
jgi:hypothetical protein